MSSADGDGHGLGRSKTQVSAQDNASVKSETSSITRPLRFGPAPENEQSIDLKTDEANVNEEKSKSNRFPMLKSCTIDSRDEPTPCCAKLASNLYNKALEGAKKALPKAKHRHNQWPRSFGEDFESLGPEGFNYFDDAQTECSYDYKDIDFRRDSILRPSIPYTETIVDDIECPELKVTAGIISTDVTKFDVNANPDIKMDKSSGNSPVHGRRLISKSPSLSAAEKIAQRHSMAIIVDAIEVVKAQEMQIPEIIHIKDEADDVNDANVKKEESNDPKEIKKRMKEMEKEQKLMQKNAKKGIRDEEKQFFRRFTKEDKKKKEIMKKQKEFEKIKRKKSQQKVETDDYDQRFEDTDAGNDDKHYEDIDIDIKDDENIGKIIDERITVIKGLHTKDETITDDPKTVRDITIMVNPPIVISTVPKQEKAIVEDIKEIGVTYVPPDYDTDGNDNLKVEETQPKGPSTVEKIKSRVGSFKFPRMGVEQLKKIKLFPLKKQQKYEKQSVVIHIHDTDAPGIGTSVEQKHENENIDLSPQRFQYNEYENIDQNGDGQRCDVSEVAFDEVRLSDAQHDDFASDEETIVSPDYGRFKSDKKKKKKKVKKNRFDRLKSKAMESLPALTSWTSKVREWGTSASTEKRKVSDPNDQEYQRFMSEHPELSRKWNRPDAEIDMFSDSELCESRRSTAGFRSNYGQMDVYEEMAATQERIDAYLSPVSGPLRPPRRTNVPMPLRGQPQKYPSVPTLPTQVIERPRRCPPPRPPPPKIIPKVQITIDSNINDSKTAIVDNRKKKQRVPASIYYSNIRLNFKPKRRFMHLKSRDKNGQLKSRKPQRPPPPNIDAKNQRNLHYSHFLLNCYGKPKPPRNIRGLNGNKFYCIPGIRSDGDTDFEGDNEGYYSGYCPDYDNLIKAMQKPNPPPRRRKRFRSKTIDAATINWQPFTWKYRRCRSLTELDIRRKLIIKQSNGVILEQSYANYANLSSDAQIEKLTNDGQTYEVLKKLKAPPPRPPPPSPIALLKHYPRTIVSSNNHIYASVYKGPPLSAAIARRPLPPPPVPPRPKCMTRSLSPSAESTPSQRESSPSMRDASVSTKDNGLIEVYEKETQIGSGNISDSGPDENGNLPEPEPPSTPVPRIDDNVRTQFYISDYDDDHTLHRSVNGVVNGNAQDFSASSTMTPSSMTRWFDAEECDDTFNDVSSINSNFQSLETLTSRYQSADSTIEHKTKRDSSRKATARSMSTKGHRDAPRPPPRLSLPENRRHSSHGIRDEDSEDTDELLGLAKDLQHELKQILNRRSQMSKISPNSSTLSLHETIDSSDESYGDGDSLSVSSLATSAAESPEFAKRKRQQKLYFIAKELTSSEEIFVDVLHLLNCDFRLAVEKTVPEELLDQILKLLSHLQAINENLLEELKARISKWPEDPRISDVMLKIGPFLKSYSLYIKDFDAISMAFEDALRCYPKFAAAVKEFESSSRCQKLSVKHYMLKPVQRIPQYRLLLQDYLRHLPSDSPDYHDTANALQVVSQVAEHANNTMKQGDNFAKLLAIQNSIIGGHEIVKPGRVFIKEGELMKLARKGMQPRWFILFNDCLMYLTPVQNGVYRVNHELSLTGMRVSLPTQQDFQNEFSVISHTRSFSLAARSTSEREDWILALNKAITENTTKRMSFAITQVPYEGIMISLGTEAPVWIPDARVTMCQLCTSEFTVTFRRHHCRCCGKVVCSACSSNKAPLQYIKNRSARVCDECYDKLKMQLEKLERTVTDYGVSSGELGSNTGAGSESDDTFNSTFNSIKRMKELFDRNRIRSSGRKPKRHVPSVLKEVCANDQGSLFSGYLHRRFGRKNWKQQWFVIKDLVLYTYKASEDVAASNSMPLLSYRVETLKEPVDGIDPKLLFQLTHPGQPSIIFRAETIGSAERWLKAMRDATILE